MGAYPNRFYCLQPTCLTAEYDNDSSDPSSRQTLQRVYLDTLEAMTIRAPEDADLLRGRFLEGHAVKKMIFHNRPMAWSERTFDEHQEAAIRRFALLLWERAVMYSLRTLGHNSKPFEFHSRA
jgi:hypothetical protein